MITPVRCFTCGEVLADKWVPYITAIHEEKNRSTDPADTETDDLELKYIDVHNPKPEFSIEGKVLNEMVFINIVADV